MISCSLPNRFTRCIVPIIRHTCTAQARIIISVALISSAKRCRLLMLLGPYCRPGLQRRFCNGSANIERADVIMLQSVLLSLPPIDEHDDDCRSAARCAVSSA